MASTTSAAVRPLPRWALPTAVGYLALYALGLVLLHAPGAVGAQSDLVYAVPALVE